MKFAYIALIAAVSADMSDEIDLEIAALTTLPVGMPCIASGTDTGCDEGSNCAATPLDDDAREVIISAAETTWYEAYLKSISDCEEDKPAGCKAELTADDEAATKEETRVAALTGDDKTANDAEKAT